MLIFAIVLMLTFHYILSIIYRAYIDFYFFIC
nr:MAG TPA: hypothetical protein [Caudoviricetes sp.]